MTINWTKSVPKRPGLYLVKLVETGQIAGMNITKLDLKVQKEDDHWLKDCYYSKQTVKEVFPQ